MNAPIAYHSLVEPGQHPAGFRLAQLALARCLADKEGCAVVPQAQQLFGGDATAITVARAATGVADTTTAGWAAELVGSETQALLRDIAPISAAAALATADTSVRLDGSKSCLVPAVPLLDPNAQAAWVGEG